MTRWNYSWQGIAGMPPPLDPEVRDERLATARERLARRSPEDAALFPSLERFCLFIGHPRSGHSALGNLLNAHRNVLISHNLDILTFLLEGYPREDLFHLVLEHERWLARRDRVIGGYSYAVDGQHQGVHDTLRVIGDKRAGSVSRHLLADPTLLRQLAERVALPLTVIHHVRNPWDNVASVYNKEKIRRGRSLSQLADHYFILLDAIARGVEQAGDDVRLVRTHHDAMVESPRTFITQILAELGLEADAGYLAAAEAFIQSSPRKTRYSVEWPPGVIERIGQRAGAYPFLDGYAFDD